MNMTVASKKESETSRLRIGTPLLGYTCRHVVHVKVHVFASNLLVTRRFDQQVIPISRLRRMLYIPGGKHRIKKSVLVLCQLKEGVGTDYRVLVQEKLIPTLEALIKTFLRKMTGNDDTTIEYMAPLNTFSAHSEQFDKVDFDMSLKTKDPGTEQFCKEHLEFYDLVVMQTCPWVGMDLQLVGSILKKGGMFYAQQFNMTG